MWARWMLVLALAAGAAHAQLDSRVDVRIDPRNDGTNASGAPRPPGPPRPPDNLGATPVPVQRPVPGRLPDLPAGAPGGSGGAAQAHRAGHAASPDAAVIPSTPPTRVFEAMRAAGIPPGDAAFLAQAVEPGTPPLFAHNAEESLLLASTTKLVTALAALDTLGPKYRWRTRAYLQGPLVDGVLQGDLLIVGGGNPSLTSTDLVAWFRQMQSRGLREIRGHIVLDRFAFRLTPADHANTPPESADSPHHRWPDALVVDDGVLGVDLTIGPAGPQLHFTPPLDGVDIDNRLKVRPGKCTSPADPPAVEVDGRSPTLRLILTGEWSAACGPRHLDIATGAGSPFSAAAVAAAWRTAGGALLGRAVDRPPSIPGTRWALPATPWAVHESPPLPTILREMNKWSNNLIARHVMLSMARGFPTNAATLPDARARLAEWLRRQGLMPSDIAVDNGSGLAHNERGRARALVQLLRNAWATKTANVFFDSLPVAGRDGTLGGRFKNGDAKGQAFLKTGTLSGSRALAGYVKAKSGRLYAVVAIVNHGQAGKGLPALDAFIEWVVDNG